MYMSTLSEREQLNLLSEHFRDYPNVMIFLCGLTELASNEMFKFVCSGLSSSKVGCHGILMTATIVSDPWHSSSHCKLVVTH